MTYFMTKSVGKKKSSDIKKPLPARTGVVMDSLILRSMNMQTNLSNQQQIIQSWFDPALQTLKGLLEERKQNLRKQKRDEKNAAVKRDEFMQALVDEHGVHGINLYHAGVIISSLYRSKRIRYLGSTFIQILGDGGDA